MGKDYEKLELFIPPDCILLTRSNIDLRSSNSDPYAGEDFLICGSYIILGFYFYYWSVTLTPGS